MRSRVVSEVTERGAMVLRVGPGKGAVRSSAGAHWGFEEGLRGDSTCKQGF